MKLAKERHMYVVCDKERIVGTGGIAGFWGSITESILLTIFVLPEYQGKGIGRMLIAELLKFINDHGIPDTDIFIELCAMPDKIPFYEKFGFSANEAQRLRIMHHVD